MAGVKSMTASEVVEWLRSEKGAVLVRESLRWVVQDLIEVEVSEQHRQRGSHSRAAPARGAPSALIRDVPGRPRVV